MAYGNKYQASYETLDGKICDIAIQQKDYSGPVYPLTLADNPVVQRYDADNPKPPINGCSLVLNLINTGTLPITDFYANGDDEFKIIHTHDIRVTFTGFLVLDDCQELMVDYNHIISLSFNDNLGLLKKVALDTQQFDTLYMYESAGFALGAPHGVIVSDNSYLPEAGVPFTITGTSFDGTFTPVSYVSGSGFITVTVVETVTTHAAEFGSWYVNKTIDFYGYNNLLSIIQACLINTGLELNTVVFTQIFEIGHKTDNSFLQQTYIDTQQNFLEDSGFKNCWDVLETIMERFKCSLFQQQGQWIIVRWDEMRYGNMNAFVYDTDFKLLGTNILNTDTNFGYQQLSYPTEISAIKSVRRPFKYDKETFNYVKPKYLILNSDLADLGDFYSTATIGDFRYDFYLFPAYSQWKHLFAGTAEIDQSKIVVVTQISLDNETDRYVFQPKTNTGGGGYEDFANVQFNDIQVSKDDVIEDFSFSIKSNTSTGGAGVRYRSIIILQADGGSYWYLNESGGVVSWVRVFAPPTNVSVANSVLIPGADAQEYYTYSYKTLNSDNDLPPFPSDGIMYIRIYGTNDSNGSQPQVNAVWKDIKITINEYINLSNQIVGQVHTQEQDTGAKDNGDEKIYLDDAPKPTIKGTLFLVSYTGFVRNKTTRWYRLAVNPAERLRLGQLITLEQLADRRVPRAKIEGDFKGIQLLGPYGRILYSPFNSIRFIAGAIEISFRNNSFTATLYEMPYNEPDALLDNTYTFTYIYNTDK